MSEHAQLNVEFHLPLTREAHCALSKPGPSGWLFYVR